MDSLFKRITPRKHRSSPTALLLDTSASMDCQDFPRDYEGNKSDLLHRRIDLLKKAVDDTPECKGIQIYAFSTNCGRVEDYHDLVPHGTTAMDEAFLQLKGDGFFNAIIVTDGQPDSEERALAAASGMRLGIIYIGPDPVPPFLQKLAAATNGTFAIADMTAGELPDAIAGMIEFHDRTESPSSDEGGGTINL